MKYFVVMLLAVSAFFSSEAFAIENPFERSFPLEVEFAKKEKNQHLLDGSVIEYQYQNGLAIHMELYNGKLKYEWIAGPYKGTKNQDLPYRSRKIGSKMYVINWIEASGPDFITIILTLRVMLCILLVC